MKTVTLLIRQWDGHLFYELAQPMNLVIPHYMQIRITALVSRYITHYVSAKPPRRLSHLPCTNVVRYYPNPYTRNIPLYLSDPKDTLYEIHLLFDLESKQPIADSVRLNKIL